MAATILQLGVNQVRVLRIQLLANRNNAPSDPNTAVQTQDSLGGVIPSSSTAPISGKLSSHFSDSPALPSSHPDTATPPTSAPTPTLRQSFENPTTQLTIEQQTTSLPGRLLRGMSTILPVQRLSDDEYLELLERKRREVDKRLGEIEAEEMRIFEWEEKRRNASDA